MPDLTLDRLYSTLEYVSETGRLIRKGRGHGARLGVQIGYLAEGGVRRAHIFGRAYQTGWVR